MYVSTNKYSGWRDSDGRNTSKTWRMSRNVNSYGAFFSNLKKNRWWYTSYRLIFNLVEAAVVLGIPLRNDYRSAIVVGLYFAQAIIFLLLRPYRDGNVSLFEMLQMFHNVFERHMGMVIKNNIIPADDPDRDYILNSSETQ